VATVADARPNILGFTVWQPWAWSIVHGWQDVDNRFYPPPRGHIGQFIAIHAGKRGDAQGLSACFELLSRSGCNRLPFGSELITGAIIGVVRLKGSVKRSPSIWFHGPWGWLYEDPVAIPPVECVGREHLWTLNDDVLAAVRERYLAVRRASRGNWTSEVAGGE
jgi:hypothetical protein